MILNCFEIIRVIEEYYGEFDDSVYIIDYGTNQIKLSINSLFDWEELSDILVEKFPQADFQFNVICLDLTINW